jgi:hypothetical protein
MTHRPLTNHCINQFHPFVGLSIPINQPINHPDHWSIPYVWIIIVNITFLINYLLYAASSSIPYSYYLQVPIHPFIGCYCLSFHFTVSLTWLHALSNGSMYMHALHHFTSLLYTLVVKRSLHSNLINSIADELLRDEFA